MAKDFRNKQFGRIIRGYNPEEVDEYIGYINDEYRKLERRCADSERKLALALKKLEEMHQKNASAGDAGKELAAAAVESAKASGNISNAFPTLLISSPVEKPIWYLIANASSRVSLIYPEMIYTDFSPCP